MSLFGPIYDRLLRWSRHAAAPWYLAGLSFAEASFFPIPPDVMLAPMSLARPDRALRFALITSLASVAGGLAGYAIGYYALDLAVPLLRDLGYWDGYQSVRDWFEQWGFWAVFIAGFSPIPYKLFTIAAGATGMPLAGFVLASVTGRSSRFFLLAGLIRWGGPAMERRLRRHIDSIGWTCVALLAAAFFYFR
ncbi:MAG: DedA family protein [Proteobacteria bacterium]|nr:DedA family protein [Pseudomonadota bacterium]MCH7893734.1 DedA family protein [Pseudomonadota bacterium]